MINSNKVILITWWAWFVGSNITRELVSKWFYNIYLLIRKSTNLERIIDIKEKINLSYVSLTDKTLLEEYINKIRPNIIFHLAADWANIWRNNKKILNLFETNIIWTINLVNACKNIWFEYFINTWSSSEYWEKDTAMKEVDLLEPNNEYWITKSTASMYASFIGKKYNLPIYTFRLFSVYWYYENKNRLIPTLILNYLKWTTPQLSNPNSVRDYIFIEDVVKFYLNVDKIKWDYWWIYNIWSWKQNSIENVVTTIKEILWSNINPIYWVIKPNQNEPKTWVADNNKIIDIFWNNFLSIKQWLKKTCKWVEKNFNYYK